jgi:hypothetical protein
MRVRGASPRRHRVPEDIAFILSISSGCNQNKTALPWNPVNPENPAILSKKRTL